MHSLLIRLCLLLAIACAAAAPASAQVRILIYGDSNTWGWRPTSDGAPTPRYTDSQRWPGVMQAALGPGYTVEVNGLIARTLDADLASGIGALTGQDHNGMRRLDLALMVAAPIHLVVVMLGTNDMIDSLNRSPDRIAAGLAKLAQKTKSGTTAYGASRHPGLLVVVPPSFGDTGRGPFRELFGARALAKSRILGDALKKQAARLGIWIFDPGLAASQLGIDGVHLNVEGHQDLGRAVAAEVARRVAP